MTSETTITRSKVLEITLWIRTIPVTWSECDWMSVIIRIIITKFMVVTATTTTTTTTPYSPFECATLLALCTRSIVMEVTTMIRTHPISNIKTGGMVGCGCRGRGRILCITLETMASGSKVMESTITAIPVSWS